MIKANLFTFMQNYSGERSRLISWCASALITQLCQIRQSKVLVPPQSCENTTNIELNGQPEVMEMTSTFKQQKFHLVQSGFNPSTISDLLYVLDYQQMSYIPLTDSIYQSILSGERKL